MKANIKSMILFLMIGVMASACVQRRNAEGKIGRGRNSRGSGVYNGVLANGGNASAQANSTGFMGFVSNLSNPDGSAFVPPCGVSQIKMAARANVSANGGEVSADGSEVHLALVLGCTATDSDGQAYNEIPVDIGSAMTETFVEAYGSVSGGTAQIVYRDIFGSIILYGTVSGQQFNGQIYYENDFYWSNGQMVTPGASGSLGSFSMNACSIFNCYGI